MIHWDELTDLRKYSFWHNGSAAVSRSLEASVSTFIRGGPCTAAEFVPT